MMMINTSPAYSGRRRMHLEENIEAREQKHHRRSIGDLSGNDDQDDDDDDDSRNYDDDDDL